MEKLVTVTSTTGHPHVRYKKIRDSGSELFRVIRENAPESLHKEMALRKLQEVEFFVKQAFREKK